MAFRFLLSSSFSMQSFSAFKRRLCAAIDLGSSSQSSKAPILSRRFASTSSRIFLARALIASRLAPFACCLRLSSSSEVGTSSWRFWQRVGFSRFSCFSRFLCSLRSFLSFFFCAFGFFCVPFLRFCCCFFLDIIVLTIIIVLAIL